MKTDKSRHTVWLSDEAWNQVSLHYREDNCSFQNEYIEKAIRFYTGYLDTQNASAYLPRILSDVLEGKLGALGSRMGRLLFKLAVEQSMTAIFSPQKSTLIWTMWRSYEADASGKSSRSTVRSSSRMH